MTEVSPTEQELTPGTPEYDEAMVAAFDEQLEAPPTEVEEEAPEDTQELPDYIPEKFRNAEDPYKAMAEAYAELERKASAPKDTPTDNPAETAQEAVEAAGLDWDALTGEYQEAGELSEATFEALSKAGIPRALVEGYIAGQEALANQLRTSVFEAVGGEDTYTEMVTWAGQNLTAAEITAFNDAADSGDLGRLMFAVRGLKAAYAEANGSEPRLTLGNVSAPSADVFRSPAEVTAAMRDPRYKTDIAYQKDVHARLGRSSIF